MKKIAYYLLVSLVTIVMLLGIGKFPGQAGHKPYPAPTTPTPFRMLPMSYPPPAPTNTPSIPWRAPENGEMAYVEIVASDVYFYWVNPGQNPEQYVSGFASLSTAEYTLTAYLNTYLGTFVEDGYVTAVYHGLTDKPLCGYGYLNSAFIERFYPVHVIVAQNTPILLHYYCNSDPLIRK